MALIQWPADGEENNILEQTLTRSNPAQIVQTIRHTGSAQVLNSGYGRWLGNTVLAPKVGHTPITGFMAAMSDRNNATNMPVSQPTVNTPDNHFFDARPTPTEENAYEISSNLEFFFTGGQPDPSKVDLQVGYLLRVVEGGAFVNQVLEVTEIVTTGFGFNRTRLTFWPSVPLFAGTKLASTKFMRVRSRSGTTTTTRRGRDVYEPFEFLWEQALD